MTWVALAGWAASVAALLLGWRWRSRLADIEQRLASKDRALVESRGHAVTLREELFRSRLDARGWQDQLVRLESVIRGRDKELLRYADALEKCTDPAAIGVLLRSRLRESLPRPIPPGPITKKLPQ